MEDIRVLPPIRRAADWDPRFTTPISLRAALYRRAFGELSSDPDADCPEEDSEDMRGRKP